MRPAEHLSDSLLALAHVFVEQLGPLNYDKVGPDCISDGLGYHSFPASGWTIEQDTAALHIEVELSKSALLAHRDDDFPLQFQLKIFKASDIV